MKPATCTAALAASVILSVCLLGCGASITALPPITPIPPAPTPVSGPFAGVAFTGKVLAGPTPITGASVQLYAAGLTGIRKTGGPLFTAPLISDPKGAFTVPTTYSCPSASTQLYLVATGGSATPAGTSNPAITLLTGLGPCGGITPAGSIVLNEATTTAAAYALAQFLGPGGTIGASPTNATGLENAFQTAAALASPLTGLSPGPTLPANVSSPAARVNTLANLLNPCATSIGATTAASPCAQLFAASTPPGQPAPTNTLDAALAITQHPSNNVAALYTLARATSTFSPALTAPPSDFTLALTVSGGGLNAPTTLALQSTGNIWVANYFGVASAFTPLGAPVFLSGITGSGIDHSYGVAVDAADNAWIANEDKSTVTTLTTSGTPLSGAAGFSAGGIDFPVAVAIDPDQSVWIADYGNAHLSRLSPSGVSLAGPTGFASPQIAFPTALAIDAAHNAWVANSQGTTLTRVSQDGATIASVTCCNGPDGVAIDQHGFVWAANFYANTVSQVSNSLTVVSPGYPAPALNRPLGIAIDGDGNVWVASFRGQGIVELAGSQTATPGTVLSPPLGWAHDAPLLEPYSLAIDASGNLWIANFGNATLTQIVGLAAPAKTPTLGPVQVP